MTQKLRHLFYQIDEVFERMTQKLRHLLYQIDNVDVIPDAGPVGCRVVGAEDRELVATSDRDLKLKLCFDNF